MHFWCVSHINKMWKAHNTNGDNLQANILGQLEAGKSPFQAVNLILSLYHSRFRRFTAGTPYFEGFIAMVSHQEYLMLSYPIVLISLPICHRLCPVLSLYEAVYMNLWPEVLSTFKTVLLAPFCFCA